ncbi:MAG: cysteine dioxygenase [Terriglobales bacterium]
MSTLGQKAVAAQTVPIREFVAGLRKFPEAAFTPLETIQEYLAQHPVDPASLTPYLFWDRQHYTRNLIDATPLYDLIALCWEAGQHSSVHNHRDQNCWMAVPIGRLLVQNYRVLFQDLKAGKCDIRPSDIVEMNASNPLAVNPAEPVHKVYNPREFGERAVSLHVYSRPFDSCDVYSEEKHTCGEIKLSYNSQYGEACEK